MVMSLGGSIPMKTQVVMGKRQKSWFEKGISIPSFMLTNGANGIPEAHMTLLCIGASLKR
jgi:hypothetical protein